MPSNLPLQAGFLWFGPALVVAIIAALTILARVANRRAREDRRDDALKLRNDMQSFLEGSIAVADLRACASRTEPEAFWTVLETASLGRRLPLRLIRALSRCPHVAKECTALHDDSPWRRELAARRLGLIRSRLTRRALRRALVRGPEMVTHSAARALARQRDGAALRWLLKHPRSLSRRTARARFEMLRAFGPGAHPLLLDALESGVRDGAMERAIVDTLGAAHERLATHAVARLLSHVDPETRVAAARALGSLAAHETAAQLCSALRDPAWPVRAQAARSLGRLGVAEAVSPLGAGLEDRAWWVRHHSAYALAKLGEEGRAELDRIRRVSADRYAREMADEALAAS